MTLDFMRDRNVFGVGMMLREGLDTPLDTYLAALNLYYKSLSFKGPVPKQFNDVRFTHSGLKVYEYVFDDTNDPEECRKTFNTSILNGLIATLAFPFQRQLDRRWRQYQKELLVMQCKLQSRLSMLLDSLLTCADVEKSEKQEK